MLIDIKEVIKKYNFTPKGIIHVGAHYAEEFKDYVDAGITSMIFIEACKEAYDIMCTSVNKDFSYRGPIHFLHCACGELEGNFKMNVSHNNQGQSNSLLQPNLHLQQHPEVVFTDTEEVKVRRLDNIMIDPFIRYPENYNILAMDVQGFEKQVLKGASKLLNQIKLVYSEVNRGDTYSGNALIEEIDEYLQAYGFSRVETYWPSANWTWGDAVYIKDFK